jgi:hypothetical protein
MRLAELFQVEEEVLRLGGGGGARAYEELVAEG